MRGALLARQATSPVAVVSSVACARDVVSSACTVAGKSRVEMAGLAGSALRPTCRQIQESLPLEVIDTADHNNRVTRERANSGYTIQRICFITCDIIS